MSSVRKEGYVSTPFILNAARANLKATLAPTHFPKTKFFCVGFVYNASSHALVQTILLLLIFFVNFYAIFVFFVFFLLKDMKQRFLFFIFCESYVPQKYGTAPIFCTYLEHKNMSSTFAKRVAFEIVFPFKRHHD